MGFEIWILRMKICLFLALSFPAVRSSRWNRMWEMQSLGFEIFVIFWDYCEKVWMRECCDTENEFDTSGFDMLIPGVPFWRCCFPFKVSN